MTLPLRLLLLVLGAAGSYSSGVNRTVHSSVRLKNDGGTACFNVPYGAKVLSYDTQPLHSSSAAQGAKGFHVVSYGPPPLSTPTTTGPTDRQLVYVSCASPTEDPFNNPYRAYLHAALLSVAGLFPGVTQVCYVRAGAGMRRLALTDTHLSGDWMPPAGVVPRATGPSQWVMGFTCSENTGIDSEQMQLLRALQRQRARADPLSQVALHHQHEPGWWSGVYWDRRAQQATPSLRHRPLLLSAKGETFWAQSYPSCEMMDVTLYRAKTFPSHGCFNLHWSNGVAHFGSRVRNTIHDLLEVPALDVALGAASTKRHFCAFVFSKCYSSLYELDATVRVIMFDLLAPYKPVHGMAKCRKSPGVECTHAHHPGGTPRLPGNWTLNTDVAAECLSHYKFAIVFENQADEGYVTEKVYNALLAPTIPIYFGASDIGEYVNIDKLVHCRLPVWKVMELRGYINRHKIRSLVRRHELQAEEVVQWMRDTMDVAADLQPCVDEVIRLDKDDAAYAAKLALPNLPAHFHGSVVNSPYDGSTVAKGLFQILKTLDSPLLDVVVGGSDRQTAAAAAAVETQGEGRTPEARGERRTVPSWHPHHRLSPRSTRQARREAVARRSSSQRVVSRHR